MTVNGEEFFDLLGLGVPFYFAAATYGVLLGSIAMHQRRPQKSFPRSCMGAPITNRTSEI
jgi:hypothetical protein